MKKFFAFFIFICLSTYPFLSYTSDVANNKPADVSQGGLDDEALEWLNEFFSQFSEEELAFYAKKGEEYIAEEMAKGKDIDTIVNEVFEPFEIEADKIAQEPTEIPTPTTPTPILVDVKKLDEVRVLLKTIIDKIEAIRQRAQHSRKTRELLKPWRYNLDDLVYYMHQLSQEKLLKYLSDKEFTDLFELIRQLAQELSFYEPLFQLPQISIEIENPYEILGLTPAAGLEDVQERYQQLMTETSSEFVKRQMIEEGKTEADIKQALANMSTEREAITQSYSTILAQEQSVQSLMAVIEAFARAIYNNDLFGKIKSLMQKYEPEALKIKEEQEKREAAARKEQEELLKKRPVWTPLVREPLVDFTTNGTVGIDKTAPYIPSFPSDLGGIRDDLLEPTTPGAPTMPGKMPAKAKTDKAKKDEKEKEEDKKIADDKTKRKKLEVPKKVADKAKKMDGVLEGLTKYLDQKPKERDEVSPFAETKTRDIFKNFQAMLQIPLPLPHAETEPELAKAKEMSKILVEITKKLNDYKRELREMKDFSKQEKNMVKKDAAVKFNKFTKDYLEKYLLDLISTRLNEDNTLSTPAGNKTLPNEKKYIFFGINEYGNDGKDINKDEYKAIIKLNEPKTQQIGDQEVTQPINFVQQLKETLQVIQKELKGETR